MTRARWTRRVGVGAMLGVLTTIAIAWSAAALRSAKPTSIHATAYIDPTSATPIRVCELRWFGVLHAYAVRAAPQESLPPCPRPAWLPSDYTLDQTYRRTFYGWPFTAFVTNDRSTFLPSASGSSPPTFVSLERPRLWAVDFRGYSYRFPYVPHPLGFTANVVLWAIMYALSTEALLKLRRGRPTRGATASAAPSPECVTSQNGDDARPHPASTIGGDW